MNHDRLQMTRQAELKELNDLVLTKFREREQGYHDPAAMPMENLKELWDRGWLTATVKSPWGGMNSNLRNSEDPGTFLQAIRTVARGSPGTAHCVQVQNHTAWCINEVGTPEQQEMFVKPMFERLFLSSFVGSEAGRRHMYVLKTTAKRVDGGYVVNGNKNYATNGLENGLAIIFCSIEGQAEYQNAHLMVIVTPDMKGVSVNHEWYRPTGMRVAASPEIYLDNVFVPDSHVLGQPGEYPKGRWQGRFHLGFAANYLGCIEGAYQWTLDYVKDRKSKDPFTQMHFGEMKVALTAARTMFENAIHSWTTRSVVQAELASMEAKSICAQAALDISRRLIQIAGSTALFDEFPLGRLIRDLNTHILHVGHDRTHQIIGCAELGESFDSTLQR